MDNLIQVAVDYWILGILVVGAITVVYNYIKHPSKTQLKRINAWLIHACVLAEKELGSNKGQIKLRFVYDKCTDKFKWTDKLITFEKFK